MDVSDPLLIPSCVTKVMLNEDLNERAGATKILKTLFSNLVNQPNEAKYRKVPIGAALNKLIGLDGGKQVCNDSHRLRFDQI